MNKLNTSDATTTHKNTITTYAWVGFCIGFLICAGISIYTKINLIPQQPPACTIDTIVDYISKDMTESPLRNNLLIVFGTEYNGDSQELNKLLNRYAEIKLSQINPGI